MRIAARVLWSLLAVCVLLLALRGYDGKPNSDAEELVVYGMLLIGFPGAVLFPAAMAAVGLTLRACCHTVLPGTSHVSIGLDWLFMFALGYCQWFVVLPLVCRRIAAKKKRITHVHVPPGDGRVGW